MGLDGDVPDHSTCSKNRHGRFRDSDVLRKLFETVVARCMREGLVGGEAFAVDASLIVADAHRRRGVVAITSKPVRPNQNSSCPKTRGLFSYSCSLRADLVQTESYSP